MLIFKDDKANNTMAVGSAFFTIGVFLFFIPLYLGDEIATRIVGILLCGIGLTYFSIGLGKSVKAKTSYIGIGALFLSLWGILYYFINLWWLNIIGLLILLVGVYGIYSGIFNYLEVKAENKEKEKKPFSIKSFVLFVSEIAAFVFTVVQILALIGVIKGN